MATSQKNDEENVDVATSESNTSIMKDGKDIHKFVLTGGPCAGKSTAMARISVFLRTRGFRVFVVPEAATMLFQGGMSVDDLGTAENRIEFQSALIQTQMGLEDSFTKLAQLSKEPAVVLCDRGCMDGSAYMEPVEWDSMLTNLNLSVVDVREARYNAVIHLVTAADGQESFYTLDNNDTRTETPEVARELDLKLRKAWVGHPTMQIIDNSTTFEPKLQKVIDVVAQLVGLPSSQKKFNKYLLDGPVTLPDDVVPHEFEIEKIYLKITNNAENTVDFARKRYPVSNPNSAVYGKTSVIEDTDGNVLEKKRIITNSQYKWLFETQRDMSRKVVRQKRTCFVHEDIYYEIHEYVGETPPLQLLLKQMGKNDKIEIPSIFDVKMEVTNNKEYSAQKLSLLDSSVVKKHTSARWSY